MGVESQTASVEIWEGQDLVIMARLMSPNGVAQTSSHMTDYTVKIYDVTHGHEAGPIYTLVDTNEANVMKGSLTTDAYWTADSTGYTMLYELKQATLDTSAQFEGGHNYIVDIALTVDEGASTATGIIPVITYVTVRSRTAG